MRILIPIESLNEYGTRDAIPFACEQCGETFHKTKNEVQRVIKGTKSIECCSQKCSGERRKQAHRVDKICKCGVTFSTRRGDNKKSCSQKCSNSRKMSEEQKEKLRIASSGKTYPSRRKGPLSCSCIQCGKPFLSVNRQPRKLCSKTCSTTWKRITCCAKPGMGRNNNSRAAWYESPIAGRVWLESSWERQCAEIFDSHNIKWERPKTRFLWKDETGKPHHYYPDFYLPNHDLYLDPKNPWQQKKDRYKLEQVRQNHAINLLILDKASIEKEPLLRTLEEWSRRRNSNPAI